MIDEVKKQLNKKWYCTNDNIYSFIYMSLKVFLTNLQNREFTVRAVMSNKLADEIGATYGKKQESKEIPNPFYGQEFCEVLGWVESEDDGLTPIITEAQLDTSNTMRTVPLDERTVLANIMPAIKILIAEYEATNYDGKEEWFIRACKLVPFLWD